MFISEAFAAPATATAGAGSMGGTLIQLALILLIFYFFLIRPQQKKIKAHTDMVEALKVGDKVITNGGLYGTVAKLNGMEISLEIAPDVVVVVDRMSISGVVPVESNKTAKPKNKKNIENTK